MSSARCSFEERLCARGTPLRGSGSLRGQESVLLMYDCEAEQTKEAGIMRRRRKILTGRQRDLAMLLKKRASETFLLGERVLGWKADVPRSYLCRARSTYIGRL